MRLVAMIAASLALTALPALAERPDPVPLTAVSFSPDDAAPAVATALSTESASRRPFDFGQPEGSGFREGRALAPRATATGGIAARRQHRAFVMPWQMGVFQ